MAKTYGSRFKLSRHLGANVFGHPKALNRGIKIIDILNMANNYWRNKIKAYYGY